MQYVTIVASRESKLPSTPLWITLGFLWTLLLCGIAVLSIVGMFWWQAWYQPSRGLGVAPNSPQALDDKQKVFERTLDAYKTQVDDLQRLISLLVGLSSFYALALGITSYLTAQHFIEGSKESAERVARYRREMEKAYPVFINFGSRINTGIRRLTKLLPNRDERDEYWARLSEKDKQEILFLERSMSFVEHLNWKGKRIALMYQGLGRFYSAWYSDEKGRLAKKAPLRIQDFAVRAYFYLERAVDRDSSNFAAMNDFALACDDMADLPTNTASQKGEFHQKAQHSWKESLRLEQRQQRARYNLACVFFDNGETSEAEGCLTEALKYRNWQVEPNELRVKDIHYNRACYRSKLGQAAEEEGLDWEPWLRGAAEDLELACNHYDSGPRVRKQTLDTLQADCKEGGDLEWIARKQPEAIAAAIAKLNSDFFLA